jgi:CBS domain-containing protein
MSGTVIPQLSRTDQIRVEEVMHTGIVGCSPSTQLPAIARILAEQRIHAVVVRGIERTREGERLTWGILNDRDVMRAIDAGDGSVTAGQLAMPAEPTVDRDEPLDRAIQLMASYDVSHVIVLDRGYPVGIVSALDVAGAAAGV